MRDPHLVEIFQTREDLPQKSFRLFFRQPSVVDDELKKFTVGTEFQKDVIVVFVLEQVDEAHDRRVVELLVDADFALESLEQVMPMEAAALDHFAREKAARARAKRELDDTEGPLADHAAQLIIANSVRDRLRRGLGRELERIPRLAGGHHAVDGGGRAAALTLGRANVHEIALSINSVHFYKGNMGNGGWWDGRREEEKASWHLWLEAEGMMVRLFRREGKGDRRVASDAFVECTFVMFVSDPRRGAFSCRNNGCFVNRGQGLEELETKIEPDNGRRCSR
jgi:hypothetical protein